ncbi:histidine phosphatase family protein [Stappia sp. ES.058]|uniref:histidine phosphatase family protein n=1 Tax=Stappia sp. ES.058 TaxID=1881061 RepID=UPI00087BA352|nr:histidine phosphatase family protein [Stappia sp. ES.058]SDT92959.1 probable phosphoglycerate mutase [Stappia sp. ES.058]
MSDTSGGTVSVAPPYLIFIRHGQTDWNAEGRMQGHKDIELNETGRGQARRNATTLRTHFEQSGLSLDDFHFAASPMLRTMATMRIVCEVLDRGEDDFTVDERLREITFGAWEGYTIPELTEQSPELVAGRKADKWGFVPPEGESYKMLASRIEAWLATVTQPTVVVSHGGVMRVVRGRLQGVPDAEIPKLDVPQDQFFVWDGSRLDWV